MKRGMSHFRDAQARAQQELLAELEAKEQQQQAAAAAEQQAQQQPAPQPQQPDPAAQERARLAAEQQRLANEHARLYWERLSESERAAAHELAQLQQWHSQAQGDERIQWLGAAEQRWHELQGHLR